MIVHLLGVPMDLGSGRRGVDMGPSAIRIAGLATALRELGHTVVDEGDITIKNMELLKVGDVHARYLAEIVRASTVACGGPASQLNTPQNERRPAAPARSADSAHRAGPR